MTCVILVRNCEMTYTVCMDKKRSPDDKVQPVVVKYHAQLFYYTLFRIFAVLNSTKFVNNSPKICKYTLSF